MRKRFRSFNEVIEVEREIDIAEEVIVSLLIKVAVVGDYYPATWGYDGGSPEEWPEPEIQSVTWCKESGEKVEVPECWWPFNSVQTYSIWEEALIEAQNNKYRDYE